jgi:nondiscriminating aspartyl-tRNA synthetase
MLKQKIIDLLKQHNVDFHYSEHEETPTSADSARVRGTPIEIAAKAIILKDKKSGENLMLVLSGHLKIDFKKVEAFLPNIKGKKYELTFENPEIIKEKYNVIVGGVPPFGELMGITTLYDESVFTNEQMVFNCGERTASIEMKTADYKKIIDSSKIGQFSKQESGM